jgi:hypothetical protein
MLPPKHSVTEKPLSLISPVNSSETPFNTDPHSVWIRRQEVTSDTMVLKFRVLRPLADVRVLGETLDQDRVLGWITNFPCIGSHIQTTGTPDS